MMTLEKAIYIVEGEFPPKASPAVCVPAPAKLFLIQIQNLPMIS